MLWIVLIVQCPKFFSLFRCFPFHPLCFDLPSYRYESFLFLDSIFILFFFFICRYQFTAPSSFRSSDVSAFILSALIFLLFVVSFFGQYLHPLLFGQCVSFSVQCPNFFSLFICFSLYILFTFLFVFCFHSSISFWPKFTFFRVFIHFFLIFLLSIVITVIMISSFHSYFPAFPSCSNFCFF